MNGLFVMDMCIDLHRSNTDAEGPTCCIYCPVEIGL